MTIWLLGQGLGPVVLVLPVPVLVLVSTLGVWQTDRSIVVVWGPLVTVIRRTDIRRITYGRFISTNSRLSLCFEGPVGRFVAVPGGRWRNQHRELDAYIALCLAVGSDLEGEVGPTH